MSSDPPHDPPPDEALVKAMAKMHREEPLDEAEQQVVLSHFLRKND